MKASAIFLALLCPSICVLQAKKEGRPGIDQMAKGSMHFTHLYYIAKDRTEIHNLAIEKPDLALELADAWHGWTRYIGFKVK